MTEQEKAKEEVSEILVVSELPTTQVRTGTGADGKNYELITIEEAVTEILKATREIKLAVA